MAHAGNARYTADMISLNPDELRVLGVLIEKELTTPEQYPLTLNATTAGVNQKNNRDPVVSCGPDRVADALDSLREKGLVVRVDSANSRVPKYRSGAAAKLGVNRYELVILAELMLRGPQTVGELRGRASRMHHLDSLEVVREMLTQMAGRDQPLVRHIPPSPGSRAERWMQLLCPEADPLEAAGGSDVLAVSAEAAAPADRLLHERVELLERQVEKLTEAIRKLATSLGESDPLA